jgi:hypothetical protein
MQLKKILGMFWNHLACWGSPAVFAPRSREWGDWTQLPGRHNLGAHANLVFSVQPQQSPTVVKFVSLPFPWHAAAAAAALVQSQRFVHRTMPANMCQPSGYGILDPTSSKPSTSEI